MRLRFCIDRHLGSLILLITLAMVLTVAESRRSPITLLGGDSVKPAVVKAGEYIFVTRYYKVKETTYAQVIRKLRSQGCRRNCDDVELGRGDITLTDGEDHIGNTKKHLIPVTTPPGKYELRFEIITDDIIGRSVVTKLPVLMVEVTQ